MSRPCEIFELYGLSSLTLKRFGELLDVDFEECVSDLDCCKSISLYEMNVLCSKKLS